ncbi:MAG TPA: hypothetical protein QGH92_01070 [Candidatus Parcubacteria bacterium]|jgi:hypothetical protein|nr:hypothetical protein [Parcubacteria group bacterium]HJN62176.1 hypothetical protein [Candidatus Parcubacteria bacterium]|tara:strand:+ start:616 stop:1002 length:387 start_codon:yes stop_codon:yes gene_type:complete
MNQNILFQFVEWYFVDQTRLIFGALKNLLKFNLNYFSIPELLKTLFSPWRRYNISYGRGFDIKRFFEVLVFNVLSRVLGAIMRVFLIIIGTAIEVIIFFLGILAIFFWLLLPILLILGLVFGLRQIIL